MKGRDCMRAAVPGPLALLNAKLWAAAPGATKLLVVMLRGAYDGASLLVPYSSEFYYRSRPGIAVPRPDSGGPDSGVALDADWALNAAVGDSLHAMYAAKQAAFLPFSGRGDLVRSHCQAQGLIGPGKGSSSAPRD